MTYDYPMDWMDADELTRPQMRSARSDCGEVWHELDDLPAAEACMEVEWTRQPAEPDVGIFTAYVEAGGKVVSWRIGGLVLDRAQLVAAIGEDAVRVIEDRAADQHARVLEEGGEA